MFVNSGYALTTLEVFMWLSGYVLSEALILVFYFI